MAPTAPSTPDVATVDVYLQGVAKNLLHKFYGPEGLPWGAALTSLEDLVLALQQALAGHCFTLALTQQAQQLPAAAEACRQCPSCGQTLTATESRPRSTKTRAGLAAWAEPVAYCSHCRRDFFPQSRALGIDQSDLSPGLLRKVISVASRCRSFGEASELVLELANLDIDPKQVERLVHRIGQERVEERDAEALHFEQLPLAEKFRVPPGVAPPPLAVVMVDGGRLQIRGPAGLANGPATPAVREATPRESAPAAEATPAAPAAGEPKARHWREDKVGLLLTMESEPSGCDPCPVIPPAFLDLRRIPKLAREIRKQPRQGEEAAAEAFDPEADAAALEEQSQYTPPKPGQRKVVASRIAWPRFAVVVAAAAWALGFQGARRQAFVGDGSDNNWEIHQRFFGSFVPILDFIHALSYVYAAATAAGERVQGWRLYRRWIRWVWGGQVAKVVEELAVVQAELGQPTKADAETSPRVVVAEALRYLGNQADRMKYPEYRQAGLPITSSLVESTVKQINHRVKGTEKFWTEEGAEAILQLRADQLSTDGTLEAFWDRRQRGATGQRRYRRSRRAEQPSSRPRRHRHSTPQRRRKVNTK